MITLLTDELGLEVVDQGVYMQTSGPRFETKAEVRVLCQLGGTVVGMTCAHEATLAKEVGIPYAVVSMVDNMANGVSNTSVSLEEFRASVKQNLAVVESIARAVVASKSSFVFQEGKETEEVDLIVNAKFIVPVEPEGVLIDHAMAVSNVRD